ncbi:uncharacterized protein LOC117652850 [Thrips palmi]|uniref:Uncharacterized protein LOC117652850 n=1 Tax=Thrips palmi TaxID=161013 RepID=A0A6P9A8P8_THRPL|nr:uncharacterized protein LOC117652850 [Thrips palmi]XP_034253901.1 uncharacterized protein LOC117652850 [Thrips palmi]
MTSPLKRLWSIGHQESRLTQWVRAKRRAQERRQQPQAHRRFSDDQHACRGCHANYFRETAQRRADWMTCSGCGGWYHVRCANVNAVNAVNASAAVRERAPLALCGQCAS